MVKGRHVNPELHEKDQKESVKVVQEKHTHRVTLTDEFKLAITLVLGGALLALHGWAIAAGIANASEVSDYLDSIIVGELIVGIGIAVLGVIGGAGNEWFKVNGE